MSPGKREKGKAGSRREAVALRYEIGEDRAPRVTAKGRGVVAEKILEAARRHGVPVREDPDLLPLLARLDLYQEVPPALYRAVAEVLAFVYALNEKGAPERAETGGGRRPPPAPPAQENGGGTR